MPNSTQEQAERRVALRRLLRHGPAETQRSIVGALNAEGHTATQSSVSRDLRELGAIKTASGYELPGDEDTDAEQMSGIAGLLRDDQPGGTESAGDSHRDRRRTASCAGPGSLRVARDDWQHRR